MESNRQFLLWHFFINIFQFAKSFHLLVQFLINFFDALVFRNFYIIMVKGTPFSKLASFIVSEIFTQILGCLRLQELMSHEGFSHFSLTCMNLHLSLNLQCPNLKYLHTFWAAISEKSIFGFWWKIIGVSFPKGKWLLDYWQ